MEMALYVGLAIGLVFGLVAGVLLAPRRKVVHQAVDIPQLCASLAAQGGLVIKVDADALAAAMIATERRLMAPERCH